MAFSLGSVFDRCMLCQILGEGMHGDESHDARGHLRSLAFSNPHSNNRTHVLSPETALLYHSFFGPPVGHLLNQVPSLYGVRSQDRADL